MPGTLKQKTEANQSKKALVIIFANTIVKPEAMVVKLRNTFIACTAMFGLQFHVLVANLAVQDLITSILMLTVINRSHYGVNLLLVFYFYDAHICGRGLYRDSNH